MDAKKLNEEESSSTSLTPRSASSVQPTSLHNNHNNLQSELLQPSSTKSWPGKSLPTFQSLQKDDTSSNTTPQSISLNNESKQQQSSSTHKKEESKNKKENQHSNNFTAMKQIMRRKQLSTAAMARKNSSTNDVELVANAHAAMDHIKQ